MLVKVGDNITNGNYSEDLGAGDISGGSSSSNNAVVYFEGEVPYNGDYEAEVDFSIYNNGGPGGDVYVYVDGEHRYTTHVTPDSGGTTSQSIFLTVNGLKKGQTLKISYKGKYTSSSNRTSLTAVSGNLTTTILLFKTGLKGNPRVEGILGNLGIITIYGKHIDNVYYGGIINDKATSARTGSITLGNAVGFLEINYNGQIVKVPYYN